MTQRNQIPALVFLLGIALCGIVFGVAEIIASLNGIHAAKYSSAPAPIPEWIVKGNYVQFGVVGCAPILYSVLIATITIRAAISSKLTRRRLAALLISVFCFVTADLCFGIPAMIGVSHGLSLISLDLPFLRMMALAIFLMALCIQYLFATSAEDKLAVAMQQKQSCNCSNGSGIS